MLGISSLQSMDGLSQQDQDRESIDSAEFCALHYPVFRAAVGARDPEAEQIVLQHNHDAGSGKTPHYYQANAVNAAIEAMAIMPTHAGTTERDDGSRIDMTRAIDRKRRVDTAFKVSPGLYRAIAGPKAHRKTYRQFPPGFFDPIVIDECHRSSAADDSVWREIPEYFSPATRIGLTATPMETRYVFNIGCFGERCYDLSTATSPESGR